MDAIGVNAVPHEDLSLVFQEQIIQKVLDLNIANLILNWIPEPRLVEGGLSPPHRIGHEFDLLDLEDAVREGDRDDIGHADGYFEIGKKGLNFVMQMKLFVEEGLFVPEELYLEGMGDIFQQNYIYFVYIQEGTGGRMVLFLPLI